MDLTDPEPESGPEPTLRDVRDALRELKHLPLVQVLLLQASEKLEPYWRLAHMGTTGLEAAGKPLKGDFVAVPPKVLIEVISLLRRAKDVIPTLPSCSSSDPS